MDSTRRTSRNTLRRVAMMAALAALLAPAGSAEAATKKRPVKKPVVTSVSPMQAEVNDILTIRGRNFRRGRGRNTVVFKRDGSRAVFVKADVATAKMLKVKVPERLVAFMANVGQAKVPTVFRIRVLSQRFGKKFTSLSRSPKIGPDTPPPPPPIPSAADDEGDCDGDGVLNGRETDADNDGLLDDVELSLQLDPCKVDTDGDGLSDKWEHDCDRDGALNRDETDDDNDMLADSHEGQLMTDPCSADSDADGVEDAYEYRSATDLNEDDYQSPNISLPYPGKRPYPNPLFADAATDYDGDGLTLTDEFKLWTKYGVRSAENLLYSDGKQYSRNISATQYRTPMPAGGDPTFHRNAQFLAAAAAQGYSESTLLNMNDRGPFDNPDSPEYDEPGVLDGGTEDPDNADKTDGDDEQWGGDNVITDVERYYYDLEYSYYGLYYNNRVSDDQRDEDADGLPNWSEAHGFMTSGWWAALYGKENAFSITYANTVIDDPDSDGDGVLDGADDQDHDDVPNVRELSRIIAAGEVVSDDIPAWTLDPTDIGPDAPQFLRGLDDPNDDAAFGQPFRGWVNPFNPCIPNPESRTCSRYVPVSKPFAPFDREYVPYLILN